MIVIRNIGVYCRVSSEDQQERGTIGTQIEFAEKYADLHKFEISYWYKDDGISGTIPLEEREYGSKLVEDAKNKKIELLLIYKLDRLGRTARVILNAVYELEQNGVMVRSMTEPFDTGDPNGRFLLTVLAAVADLDRETTLERLWHGANRAARSGKWLGGIVPYGYKVNDNRLLEISEELLPGKEMSEADVVKLIYKLVCEHNYTTVQVADYLNALGIPPSYTKDNRKVKKGKRKVNTSGCWLPGRISNMLSNPTYKGVHYYGKRTNKQRELITREMPAIISEDTWEQARQVLKENRLECFNRSSSRNYLLRGLIKCGICGLTYHGTQFKYKAYYVCNGKTAYRGPQQGKCTSKNIPQEWVEDLVWNDCLEFINNPGELLNELVSSLGEKESRKAELDNEKKIVISNVAQKEIEKERILDLYRTSKINNIDVEKQLIKISQEKEILLQRVSAIEKQISTEESPLLALNSVEQLLADLRIKVKESASSFENRREIVRLLVDKIIVETKINENNRLQADVHVQYNFFKGIPRTDRDSSRRQT